MSEKRMQIMRDASYLLPPPGGEVVRELLDRHAALLARHNKLREEFEDVKDHNQYLEACLEDRNAEMMRHVRMYETLCDAVAWERECCQDIRPLVAWADLYARHGEDYVGGVAEDLRAIQADARAEVDRLIATADCKGEE